MDSFNRDPFAEIDTDGTAQKGRERDSLFLMAQIRIDDAPAAEVRIRNLSEGGLMAELDEVMADRDAPLETGTPVQVLVRGVGWVRGKIAWFAENRAGIAFNKRIDPKLARKPVGSGATTPYYAKALTSRKR